MIDFIRTDHINICVPPERLEEAHKFYTEVIGLKQIPRPDEIFKTVGYWFAIGDIALHISVEDHTPKSSRHTAFEVADIAAARAVLAANNVKIVEEPKLPGRDRFAFIDPFDNRMELIEITG